jgi:hypothetical protein
MCIDLVNTQIYLNNKLFPKGLGQTGNDTTGSSTHERKFENKEKDLK